MITVRHWSGHEARALRLALRLSVRVFAECLGVAVRTVSKWEAGGLAIVPRPEAQAILDTALGRADAATQQRFVQLCGTASTRATTNGFDDPDAESVELIRRLASSDLAADTLDQLDELVERLAVEYFTVAPGELRRRALTWRRYVATLLDGHVTLRERSRLYLVAGWLTGLIAEASLALGEGAQVHCTTALSLAREVGHAGLAGWVHGTQAQVALHAGDAPAAATFAEAGAAVAPLGSPMLVRSHAYLARASARCRDRRDALAALSAAETAWSGLAQPAARGIFGLTPSYLPYCATTVFAWLGEPANALSWAGRTVEPSAAGQTTFGRAIAQLDLAITCARAAEPEQACAIGAEAMEVCATRLTAPARRRVDELFSALAHYSGPFGADLRERWRSAQGGGGRAAVPSAHGAGRCGRAGFRTGAVPRGRDQ